MTADSLRVNPQLNVVAALHMLDAYDEGKDWDCQCAACSDVRTVPGLVEAMRKELNKKPPAPRKGK